MMTAKPKPAKLKSKIVDHEMILSVDVIDDNAIEVVYEIQDRFPPSVPTIVDECGYRMTRMEPINVGEEMSVTFRQTDN